MPRRRFSSLAVPSTIPFDNPSKLPIKSSYMSSFASSDNRAPTLLSVILPAFNEQAVLPQTYARFSAMEQTLAQWGLDYELIFVNDGSRDGTPEMLNELAGKDRHVRAVHLARNFGHQ